MIDFIFRLFGYQKQQPYISSEPNPKDPMRITYKRGFGVGWFTGETK